MRGDIYRLPARRDALGHEQRGPRYGVVIQNDDLPLSTVVVAPTSTSAKAASFRPEIDMAGTVTRVLPEQARAIDMRFLGEFAGRLSHEELVELDDALRTVLALS